jgi:plasmid stabilization system protein ParE
MTFTVIANAEAMLDWNEAVDWYEEQEFGVGIRFNGTILAFLKTLSQQPERFPLVTRLTRKGKIPSPWPYSVYFTINPKIREVTIVAIWHGARNPAGLRERLN